MEDFEHEQDVGVDSPGREPDSAYLDENRAQVHDRVSFLGDLDLNEAALLSAFPQPERFSEALSFSFALLRLLPENERKTFCIDPLNFVSETVVFRGLTPEKYQKLMVEKTYMPESGHFGTKGVYFSNSPFAAFSFQNKGVIAVVERRRIQTLNGNGFHEVGSDSYKRHTDDYIANLSPTLTRVERSNALYSADDGLDLIERVNSSNRSERNLVARLPQPIAITGVFLKWDGTGFQPAYLEHEA